MGRLAKAAAEADTANGGGQPHRLPPLLALMDPEDADDFRALMDSEIAPSVLYRLCTAEFPDLPWPKPNGFYGWVRQWRAFGRRF